MSPPTPLQQETAAIAARHDRMLKRFGGSVGLGAAYAFNNIVSGMRGYGVCDPRKWWLR